MKRFDPEKFLKDKYNYLLTTEIIIILAYPFPQNVEAKFPIILLMLLVAIAPALWVGLSRKVFLAVISIGLLAFTFNVVTRFGIIDLVEEGT